MKLVSVVEVYATKISHSLYLHKIYKTSCLLRKCIAMNSQIYKFIKPTIFIWIFFFYFSFCFCTLVFRLLLYWISSEEIILLLLKIAFETFIFKVFFCYFWKDIYLCLFLSYLFLNICTKIFHGRRWRSHSR